MKTLKLLLINPPKENAVMADSDRAYLTHEGHKPPIQLLFLASHICRVLPEVDVRVLDTQAMGLSHDAAVDTVASLDPDVVGITSWTEFWRDTSLLVGNIKSRLPKVHICLGGPNVDIYPDLMLENPFVDSIVCGYGEKPLETLIRVLMGGSADQVDGLYFKNEMRNISEFKYNRFADLSNTRALPREMLPVSAYSSVLWDGPTTSVMTSKGCPFNCTFCKIMSQRFCEYPVDFVVNEFLSIQKLGIRNAEVYDDTFTVSKERVKEICNRLLAENMRIAWSVRDRATNDDVELLSLMKKAGVRQINYGIESASDSTLKLIKKGIRIADVRKAVAGAKEAGLTVLAYFMIGLPGDTKEGFQDILNLSLELDVDYANYSAVIAYPGTELYAMALSKGIFKEDVWRQHIKNPDRPMEMPLYADGHTRRELMDFAGLCSRRFYFRPRTMWREVKRLRSFAHMKQKINMARALLS